ncbi:MAG: hypothetical protein EZS28_033065, partial [Streblomastix strix]
MVSFSKIYLYLIYHDIRFKESIDEFEPPETMVFVQDMTTIKTIFVELSHQLCQFLHDAYSSTKKQSLLELFEEEDLQQVFTEIREQGASLSQNVYEMWTYNGNLIDIFNNVANYALDIGSSYWKNEDIRSKRLIYYLRNNIPVIATEACKRLSISFSNDAHKQTMIIMTIVTVIGFASQIIPLIMNIILFAKTINRLKSQRHEIFLKICLAPKSEFILLKNRLTVDEEDEEEDKKLQAANKAQKKKKNKQTHSSSSIDGINKEQETIQPNKKQDEKVGFEQLFKKEKERMDEE